MAKSSSGMRHLELHSLYQGFCWLSASSPPASSSSSPSAPWRKRYAVILESGLVFVDPAAGPGSAVDKIQARDMRHVRLIPNDHKGQTLEIFFCTPSQPTLKVHLCTTLATQHWLHILSHILIPQAHNTFAPMTDKNLFSNLPEGEHRHEVSRKASYSRNEIEDLANVDHPATLSETNSGFGTPEFSVDVQMPLVSEKNQLSETNYHSTDYHVNVDSERKKFSRQAQSLKRCTVSSENLLLLKEGFDANENCMKLDLWVNIQSEQQKEGGNYNSLSGTNVQRFSEDGLVENVLTPCPDSPSLELCAGLVAHEDILSSGPLSLLNSPENENLKKLDQSSSEGSITGLTLTSDSSEAVEGLANDGFKVSEPLVERSFNDVVSVHTSDNILHSDDALPDLSLSISTEAHPASNPVQEPKLSKDFPASLSLPKVRQSMKLSSLQQENTQAEDRYHGGEKLAQSHELSTTFVLGCTDLRWNELLTFPILLYDLPQEVRLNLALYYGLLYGSDKVESKMIGWTNFCFIDENGFFMTKKHTLKLWKDPPFYSCGTFLENATDKFCGVLSVQLDHSPCSFGLHQREENDDNAESTDDENNPPTPTDEEVDLLNTIVSTSDVITPPSEAQKHVLWQLRHALVEKSYALPKFLMSVPWNKHHCVLEAHRIITRWKPLPPFYALQLLGPQFGDKVVRDYAVKRLSNLTDEEFQLVLIQLVQALVYEPYNSSSLLQLLLERATNWTIGHHLFWLVKKHGGGAKAVFHVETLQNWLVSNNRTGEDYSIAVDNFVRSCAAYCVATCVLGIGDRHNDNVMIKRTGEFFHIDFGHILGHFKSKFGIKRERARFVFTPDMAYVMGGINDERFKHFEELCGLAFNKLRENAHLFLNLTHLMVSSGIPEIATPQNVYFLRDILVLDLSDEDAKNKFSEWIIESLQTTATQVNYAIHTWAHG